MPPDAAPLQLNPRMRLSASHADVLEGCSVHRLFDAAKVESPSVDAEAVAEPMVHPIASIEEIQGHVQSMRLRLRRGLTHADALDAVVQDDVIEVAGGEG